MKYIKKFENFSTNLNNNSSVVLTEDQLELNKTIRQNPKELQEIVSLVDLELSKLDENQKREILDNIDTFSKKENINLQKSSDLVDTITNVSELSEKHKNIYKELIEKWKAEQKALGKNTRPGQGTRNRLMRQAVQENIILNTFGAIKNKVTKGIDFIDDCLEFLKYRIGMLSSIVTIIWAAISAYSGNFSWWQIVWIVISILYWRISSVYLAKQRKFWGDDKKWYY